MQEAEAGGLMPSGKPLTGEATAHGAMHDSPALGGGRGVRARKEQESKRSAGRGNHLQRQERTCKSCKWMIETSAVDPREQGALQGGSSTASDWSCAAMRPRQPWTLHGYMPYERPEGTMGGTIGQQTLDAHRARLLHSVVLDGSLISNNGGASFIPQEDLIQC